jgi:hypothetical protein
VRNTYRWLMVALLPVWSACGPSDEEAAQTAVHDSLNAARARGETDLSNPDMGGKMLVTLTDSGMTQSHAEMPKGQLSVAIQNRSSKEHVLSLEGPGGGFKSGTIPAGGYVLMTILVDPGSYTFTCSENVEQSACGSGRLMIN